MRHAPRLLSATFIRCPISPSPRNFRSRPFLLCHRNQKHFRMCRLIHPSSRKIATRSSASWQYPHQPRMQFRQLSRGSSLVRLWFPRHNSRTFALTRSIVFTPCGSLRLPSSVPVGSFHPTRLDSAHAGHTVATLAGVGPLAGLSSPELVLSD